MSSSSGEKSFWEETYKSLLAGFWSSETPRPDGQLGTMADRELFMYVVDTKRGWIRAGAYTRNDMEVARHVSAQPRWSETMPLLVAELVRDAADSGLDDQAPTVTQALGLAMAAAACSECYNVVQGDRGDIAGHWFFFVYTAGNGSLAWNASFAACTDPGFLKPPQMADFLRKVIGANLAPEMEVGSKMVVGGGVALAPVIDILLNW